MRATLLLTLALGGCIDERAPSADGDPDAAIAPDAVAPDGAEPDAGPVPPDAAAPAPCLRVGPPTLEFGRVEIGASRELPVTLESCAETPVTVRRVALGTGTPPGYGLRVPGALPLLVEPGHPAPVFVEFAPDGPTGGRGTLLVESDGGDASVALVAAGAECPTQRGSSIELRVTPGELVPLDARLLVDTHGEPARYEWIVVARPDGSTATPGEAGDRADDPTTPAAEFAPDVPGHYVIEPRVTTAAGLVYPTDQCPAMSPSRYGILVAPPAGLHVRLEGTWPAGPDPDVPFGPDLDLHLLHPEGRAWGVAPGDCYFANSSPDWGRRGVPDDDPQLYGDPLTAAVPEAMFLEALEDTSALPRGYRIGAHAFRLENFNDGGTFAPVTARVRVYLGGVLACDMTRVFERTDDFWHVAEVVSTPEGAECRPVDTLHQSFPPVEP